MNAKLFILPAILLLSAAGCSNIRHYTMPDDKNLLSGAGSIMTGTSAKKSEGAQDGAELATTEKFELINVDILLEKYGLDKPKGFNSIFEDKGAAYLRLKYLRNDMQDHIIAASNQRCAAYLRILMSSKSQTNVIWGGLATLLSGAAAVTTPIAVSQALSAGSTMSSALLAQYNEAYFSNLAVQVVSAGIGKQREAILVGMDEWRKKEIGEYPVNRAIADALKYHASCNMVSGLETATVATKNTNASAIADRSR